VQPLYETADNLKLEDKREEGGWRRGRKRGGGGGEEADEKRGRWREGSKFPTCAALSFDPQKSASFRFALR
jgi:hypothetical protein